MLESLLRSIGVADEMVINISDTHIAFQRPLWLYALLLVLPAGWFIYNRQKSNLATVRRGFRVALTVTRVFVLAILILVLASPVLRLTEEIDKKPILAVLFLKAFTANERSRDNLTLQFQTSNISLLDLLQAERDYLESSENMVFNQRAVLLSSYTQLAILGRLLNYISEQSDKIQ